MLTDSEVDTRFFGALELLDDISSDGFFSDGFFSDFFSDEFCSVEFCSDDLFPKSVLSDFG